MWGAGDRVSGDAVAGTNGVVVGAAGIILKHVHMFFLGPVFFFFYILLLVRASSLYSTVTFPNVHMFLLLSALIY